MSPVIQVEGLEKRFKGNKAVDDVSFNIGKGEVVAILGPNGAGKSTTMHMLIGLLKPDAGQAELFGQEPGSPAVRQKVGAMLQDVSLMDAMKVRELIALFRGYYQKPMPLDTLIGLTGLAEEDLKKRTEKLSGGQKRRVAFALALAGDPDLLFFDEPTVGLDIRARSVFWSTVRKLAGEGKTIVFSTHYLQEADDAASRVLLFDRGRLIGDGSPEQIKGTILRKTVSFRLREPVPAENLQRLPHVLGIKIGRDRIELETDDSDGLLGAIIRSDIGAYDIALGTGRLEDAFISLTASEEEAV